MLMFLVLFFLGARFSLPSYANTTSFWKQAGIERFYLGTFNGTALTEDGRIVLGHQVQEEFKSAEQYLWSLAYDNKGNLWAGSGNKAILYKIDRKGDSEEITVLPGVGITALAVDSKGVVYAASMPGGTIFKIDRKGKREEFVSVMATYIWDMKFDKDDNLFCVTGLGAGAYKITPDKKVISLYSNSEKHFLSMFLDGEGNLYTGTSPGGLILKINIEEAENYTGAGVFPMKTGKVTRMGFTRFLSIGEPGEVSPEDEENGPEIEFDDTGEESSPGREDMDTSAEQEEQEPAADPRVRVLLDLEEQEAYRLLQLPDGRFLVAANRDQSAPPQGQNPNAAASNEPISFPRTQRPGGKNANAIPARLYIVTPEGRPRMLLEIPDPYIMSMHLISENEVLIGTGNEGRIYTTNIETEATTLQSIQARQILAITGKGEKLRLATGNPGAVFSPSEEKMPNGTYISTINDATTTALYGNIDTVASVPSGASLKFNTRTGNTPNPADGTWSPWSEVNGAFPCEVESPAGRYMQYKAVFEPSPAGETPRLSEVSIYYLTDNRAPEILDLAVLPQPQQRPAPQSRQGAPNKQNGPAAGQGGPPQNNQNAAQAQQGPPEKNFVVGTVSVSDEIVFRWKAEDPDSDMLRAMLEFRKIGASAWVKLEEKIYSAEYHWQTDPLSDGIYEVRLTVSDEDSNPDDRALSHDMISEPFIIDHTRPEISIESIRPLASGGYEVKASITDPTSIISSFEYSLNDLEWRPVFPVDRIFDSKSEMVDFRVEDKESEDGTILLRATDFVGNTGSTSRNLATD